MYGARYILANFKKILRSQLSILIQFHDISNTVILPAARFLSILRSIVICLNDVKKNRYCDNSKLSISVQFDDISNTVILPAEFSDYSTFYIHMLK